MPAGRYEISRWKSAKVNIDYHVEFDGHYYSVPHALVGAVVELRVTGALVECFGAHQGVACHPLSHQRGAHSTTAKHMPASHRAHLEWTPGKLIEWGARIGVSTAAVVTWQLQHRPHPEQGYRACLGPGRWRSAFKRRSTRRSSRQATSRCTSRVRRSSNPSAVASCRSRSFR